MIAIMSRRISLVLLWGLTASLPGLGQDVEKSNLKAKSIEDFYARFNDPKMQGGFAFAVIENGRVIFKKGYGSADVENSIPFAPSTVCDYASLSKQFTGFAVARLISEGLISPDENIRKYLPEIPDFGPAITVRHLLGHTSGLRDFVPLLKLAGRQDGDVVTDAYLMKMIAKQNELNFYPGERHFYCNTGYFLLAHIVSRVTGLPFGEWMRKNVFAPLGMDATQYLDEPGKIIRNRARSYSLNGAGRYQTTSDNLSAIGSSSLFSSLDDMTKWAMNLMTHDVGSTEWFDQMVEPTVLNTGEKIAYNFGLETGIRDGRRYLRHGGSWGGFLSDIICFPEEKTAVVLIANKDPLDVPVTDKVLEILFDSSPENAGKTGPMINEDKPRKPVRKEILDGYVGNYAAKVEGRNFLYLFAEVKITPENLVFHASWAQNNRLFAETDRTFFVVGAGNTYEFVCDETGRSQKVIARLNGKEYVFKRIDPLLRNRQEAEAYVGVYDSDELSVAYDLQIIENQLVFQSLQNEDVPLSWVGPDVFVTNQYWFREVTFTKDAEGQIEGFKLQTDNGNISKNIHFRKRK